MATPIDTNEHAAQEADRDFELLLEEMASILETEDDLTVDEDIVQLSDEDYHDLRDADIDLGEEFFNLRDGPIVIGSPVVDPDHKTGVPDHKTGVPDPEGESREIQLVLEEPAEAHGEHVIHFRMTPAEDRDILSLDHDPVDDEEDVSDPPMGRGTVRKRLGKLLSLFRRD